MKLMRDPNKPNTVRALIDMLEMCDPDTRVLIDGTESPGEEWNGEIELDNGTIMLMIDAGVR
jgi:hypothetical protein